VWNNTKKDPPASPYNIFYYIENTGFECYFWIIFIIKINKPCSAKTSNQQANFAPTENQWVLSADIRLRVVFATVTETAHTSHRQNADR
jgi:hypothetical protein